MNNQTILPAEWEGHSAVLISWPHKDTDWAYMLEEVTECYIDLARKLTKVARLIIVAPDVSYVAERLKGFVDESLITFVEVPTDDTWARDFGMLCTRKTDGGWVMNDFKFNGWGLKFRACNDNLINRGIIATGAVGQGAEYRNMLNFVLEGGSIDCDDCGTLMTTTECLLSPNRNGAMSQEEIEQVLKDTLGCSKVIWINHGALDGDDTDSHIDTLARFLPLGQIAYTVCDREDDEHYECLKLMEDELKEVTNTRGEKMRLIALPIPEAIYDSEGERLPATYANFLIINGAVFMPIYGDEHYDALAVSRIKEALPGYEVHTVNCRPLIQQHGSLHCVTMQLPDTLTRQ